MLPSEVWKEMESFDSKDHDDEGYDMSTWPHLPRRKVFVYKFELDKSEGKVLCFEVDDRGRHGVMTYRNPFSVVADACWLTPCGLDPMIVRGYLSPIARPSDGTFCSDVILMPDRETTTRETIPRLRVFTVVFRFSESTDEDKPRRSAVERLVEVNILLSVLGFGRLWAFTLTPESERVQMFRHVTALDLWDRPKREAFLICFAMLELMCQLDPDVVMGWNLAHWFREMEEVFGGHITALLERFSRVKGRRATFERRFVQESISIPGRIVVDPWIRLFVGASVSDAERTLETILAKEKAHSVSRGMVFDNRAHLLWNHVRRKVKLEEFYLGDQRLPLDVSLVLLAAYSA